MEKIFILGGISSGKSRYAEQLAQDSQLPVTYIATAQADLDPDASIDTKWQARIEKHRERRPQLWQSIEEPIEIAGILEQERDEAQCLLLDCISLWMTNLLLLDDEDLLQQEKLRFLDAIDAYQGYLIIVSNESSLGIIPTGELTQRYCDELGEIHQEIAARCDRVIMVIAGLPQHLKGAAD